MHFVRFGSIVVNAEHVLFAEHVSKVRIAYQGESENPWKKKGDTRCIN